MKEYEKLAYDFMVQNAGTTPGDTPIYNPGLCTGFKDGFRKAREMLLEMEDNDWIEVPADDVRKLGEEEV